MSFLIGTLSFLMLAVSLFMILLVLIQRGRGGGLAGAFGGMGGQSAFGTRAGDTFTRITIVLAVIWVLLAGGLGMMMRRDAEAAKTGKDTGSFIGGSAADENADTKSGDGASLDGAKSDAGTTDEAPAEIDSETPKATDTAPAEADTSEEANKPAETDAEKPADAEVPASDTTKPVAENSETDAEAAPEKEIPADPAAPAEETPATEPKP